MAEHEVDPLADAIAGTEKEIFGEAMDKEEVVADETGDRSPEDMGEGLEGQVDAAGADEGEEGDEPDEPEPEPEPERDPKTGKFVAKGDEPEEPEPAKPPPVEEPRGRVPPGRLREETERRTAAERRAADAEADRDRVRGEFATLEAKLDGVIAAMQRPQQPPQPQPQSQPQPEVPDIFVDPQGFVENLRREIRSEVMGELVQRDVRYATDRVESSMQRAAKSEHAETFTKGYQALTSLDRNNPDHRMVVQRIWEAPDPGEAVVNWYRSIETLREVGGDPAAYRERIASEARDKLMQDPEFRSQLLEEMRAEASGQRGGAPRHTTRLPKSLNGAGGGPGQTPNPGLYDNSEKSVFDSALSD